MDGQREFHLPQQTTGGRYSIHGAAHDVWWGVEDPQTPREANFGGNEGGRGHHLTSLHDVDWPQLWVPLEEREMFQSKNKSSHIMATS